MPYKIAFDVAHKPRGKIDENLTEIRDFLNANDYICYNFLETPITINSLKPFDILVFVCPDFAKITSMEITEISNWVRNDGGGLLLLSHAGGDRGRNSNLSELSQLFGMMFENDQVLDETYNLGMENMPIITSFIPPHPITNSIGSICYRSGCSLSVLGNSISIISSNETSEPFSSPLVCVSEPEKGRVCAIGSYELFRDRLGGGFSNEEHPNLAYNIFSWLISDYRMDLHSNGEVPEIIIRNQATDIEPSNYASEAPQSSLVEKKKVNIDFSMKISKKSELVELLKIFQNQIDMIKTTIDKLIKTTLVSEKAILESRDLPKEEKNKKKKGIDNSKSDSFDELLKTNDVLTDLPPKPEILKSTDEGSFIGLPKIDDSIKLNPVPKSTITKKVKKKDLMAEKKAMEGKLNSVRNLLDFLEKKHNSGDMDDKLYEKRTNQLKNDLISTQNRIDEIDKDLK